MPIARIWKHVRLRLARRDTTVTSSLESEIARIDEPTLEQVLDFCVQAPVERVFLDESARRGFGRLLAKTDGEKVTALCHFGANVVPSGVGTGVFAEETARSRARMIIGDEAAVSELWEAAQPAMPIPREDRPGQPVFSIDEAPEPGDSGLRPAGPRDFKLLLPACAATHEGEIGVDPLRADASGFRRRTRHQIEEGRSWAWIEDGTILFKAEASAWTPHAVQLQQVWVDPQARRQGFAQRGLRDLIRLLLGRAPRVCLFVRADNPAAIRLYEAVGMQRVGSYRSLLF